MINWLKKTALWIVAIPVLCWVLGAASNQVVLVANHDRFPVMVNDYKVTQLAIEMETVANSDSDRAPDAALALEALQKEGFLDHTHVVMTKHTHLNFLADWIGVGGVYSIGDLLLGAGEQGLDPALLIWITVVIGRLRKREDSY
jgi:hypothetical protein